MAEVGSAGCGHDQVDRLLGGDLVLILVGLFARWRSDDDYEDRGTITDPEAALQAVALLPHDLSRRYQGLDRRDVSVVFGGLAAVPFTFLAGMLIDDESQVTVLDWDRDASRWRGLDGADDGDRFVPRGLDRVPADASAAILTVSVSYKVDVPAVRATLGDLPLVVRGCRVVTQADMAGLRPDNPCLFML